MEEEVCIKCGYKEGDIKKFGLSFCSVCCQFAPNTPEELDEYIKEKIDGDVLRPLRKYSKTRGQQQKSGMIKKAQQGSAMSRAAFGYKIEDKLLVPAQNFKEIEEIFEQFLEQGMTLNKLADKHNLSVNGLKKILSNFTYIGKVKFNNQTFEGTHKPIISSILFNKVQDKLEQIRKN